jgi:hypothetical protein
MRRTILLVAVLLAACQTTEEEMTPAVLADASPETMAAVKAALAGHLGQSRIEIGAGDPTRESVIAILPPRPNELEGNSVAMPVMFDILTDGKACFLRTRADSEMILLDGVACQPLSGSTG